MVFNQIAGTIRIFPQLFVQCNRLLRIVARHSRTIANLYPFIQKTKTGLKVFESNDTHQRAKEPPTYERSDPFERFFPDVTLPILADSLMQFPECSSLCFCPYADMVRQYNVS